MRRILHSLCASFLIPMLLLCTCQSIELDPINNQSNGQIGIIGHGGLGFPSANVALPANSWESMIKAVENYQADGIEVDVQMSANGTLYLFHDERLQTQTDCLGCIYQWPDEDLDECAFTSSFNGQFADDRYLVKLSVLLDRYAQQPTQPLIFLDLKTSPDCPGTFEYQSFASTFVRSLATLFEQFDAEGWLIVESPDLVFLRSLQAQIPGIKINYFSRIDEESVAIATAEGFYGLSGNQDQVTEAALPALRNAGLNLTLGIHQTRQDAVEMIGWNPDFIYTDNIPLLQVILK